MLKFIYNNFEIDLTQLNVTFNEVNPWFEDELSAEYSFPFNMPVDDWGKISDFTNFNAVDVPTKFLGKLYRDGEVIDATLTIHEQRGKIVSGVIYAGLDIIKVLDKPLTDLPLQSLPVSDLKAHAKQVITKTYPEVNYNFRMIHTDKYDPTDEDFNGFEKVINKYVDGEFVENVIDEETNVDVIKNIMQPLPYLLHVLKKGFESGGMLLEGDVLTDPDLLQALIYRDGDYFSLAKKTTIDVFAKITEWVELGEIFNGYQHVRYYKEVTIDKRGDYIITGDIYYFWYRFIFFGDIGAPDENVLEDLSHRETEIYILRGGMQIPVYYITLPGVDSTGFPPHGAIVSRLGTVSININVQLEPNDKIIFKKLEARRDYDPILKPDYPETFNLSVGVIRYRNPDGTPIITVLDLQEITLARVVPDMGFPDFVNAVRKLKNFGLIIQGNRVIMNYVESQMKRPEAVDLSAYDIEDPSRLFQEVKSYELAFADGKSKEDYKYDSLLVTKGDVIINDYATSDTTTLISIDALCYPVLTRDTIRTAYAFDDETSKLRLVFHRQTDEDDLPVCYDNLNMTIPKLYAANYAKWLNFRLNSIAYEWEFIIPVEKFRDIQIQSLIYAFNNYHILKELEKERITRSHWRVTVKSESWQ